MTGEYSQDQQGTPDVGALLRFGPDGQAGDRVLMHPSRPSWLVGNAATEAIYRILLAQGGDLERSALALAGEFAIPLELAREDVATVAGQLGRQGMLAGPDPADVPRMGSLFLLLTERCNLACAHCWGSFPNIRELPRETALRIVGEFLDGGGRSVALSGGEPLLYPGLEELLARIGTGIPIQICSNGILITPSWAERLARYPNLNVQISLDGPTAEVHDAVRGPHAFQGAIRGLRLLQEAGFQDRLTIATTLQGGNHQLVPEIIQMAADLGVPKLRLLPLKKKGRALDTLDCTGDGLDGPAYEAVFDRVLKSPAVQPGNLEVSCGLNGYSLLPEAERGGCTVGSQLVVFPSGDVFPCLSMVQASSRIGNVNGSSLAEIVAGVRMAELHSAKLERKNLIPACMACSFKSLCQSGCMAEALEETGSLWEVDSTCGYRQQAYTRSFELILGRPRP